MFPIDPETRDYDARMLARFDELAADLGLTTPLVDLLPAVRLAGEAAGVLTQEGAARLDPTGKLRAGIALCPPEGDAGTGMVATNSVAPRTGNVSAGTSIFAMVVLDRALSRPHRELDLVTTPAGDPVAMVHCNNGASELQAWGEPLRRVRRGPGSGGGQRASLRDPSSAPRSTGPPTAAGCWRTTTSRASRSPSWRRGARWSSARPAARSTSARSCGPSSTARSRR